jgi:hypothetical protein
MIVCMDEAKKKKGRANGDEPTEWVVYDYLSWIRWIVYV